MAAEDARAPGALRVVEFYSGIGGARVGVERWARRVGRTVDTVAAYDMNLQANAVYAANFGLAVQARGIEHVKVQELDRLRANVWLMSPPCQPFTQGGGRNGKAGDADRRSDSFCHLSGLLRRSCEDREGGGTGTDKPPPPLKVLPTYILLENVVGFSQSGAAREFIATLRELGYDVKEFVASPTAVGVPYERERYYILARRDGAHVGVDPHGWCVGGTSDTPPPTKGDPPTSLATYLAAAGIDVAGADADATLRVSAATFTAHPTYRFDVVARRDREVACVTKGYGKSHKGSGSLMLVEPPADIGAGHALGAEGQEHPLDRIAYGTAGAEEPAPKRAKVAAQEAGRGDPAPGTALPAPDDNVYAKASASRNRRWIAGSTLAAAGATLRWMSPAEVAALHGYPRGFSFAAAKGAQSQWRLLGNSLSCDVHEVLAGLLFS